MDVFLWDIVPNSVQLACQIRNIPRWLQGPAHNVAKVLNGGEFDDLLAKEVLVKHEDKQ